MLGYIRNNGLINLNIICIVLHKAQWRNSYKTHAANPNETIQLEDLVILLFLFQQVFCSVTLMRHITCFFC